MSIKNITIPTFGAEEVPKWIGTAYETSFNNNMIIIEEILEDLYETKIDDTVNSVKDYHIAKDAITSIKIKDGSIASSDIGNSAIQTHHITDGHVIANKIANGAITEAKIKDSAISRNKIADFAVNSSKIESGAVDTLQLANQAVTSEKLDSSIMSSITSQINTAVASVSNEPVVIPPGGVTGGSISKSFLQSGEGSVMSDGSWGVNESRSTTVNFSPPFASPPATVVTGIKGHTNPAYFNVGVGAVTAENMIVYVGRSERELPGGTNIKFSWIAIQ